MPDQLTKQTILAVDDAPDNLDIVKGTLTPQYIVKAATSGKIALKVAQDQMPDLILLDVMMPEMDGYEVCRRLKANPRTKAIPIIFLTAKDLAMDEAKGLALGALDYIAKPICPEILTARVTTQLSLQNQNHALEEKVQERTKELRKTRLAVIRGLGRAAEFRDNETGMHIIRVSYSCRRLAQEAGLNDEDAEMLFNAAPMHDVGKIGIPDNILLKPGKLDVDEFEVMKTHTTIGGQILEGDDSVLMKTARSVALTHHEYWDGSGYPNGLKGNEIPIEGRILAVCDVFDALTSVRPYKKAWPVEDAMAFLNERSGIQFDPELIRLFENILPEIVEIKLKYADTD